MLWETSYLIWGTEWCDWCATMQWRGRTSRTRGARGCTLWCRWPFGCSSGATARRLCWFPSICQECVTTRQIPCPESARHWPRSGRWPWRVYDPCLPSGANHRLIWFWHSPTDDSSSSYRHIRPQGGVDRCHVHALGQGEGPSVRLPAIQDGPSSSAEDRSITRSAGDTDRSTATGSIMVPRADGPIPRRPDSAVRRRSRPADTRGVHGRGRDRDSSLPAIKSSRVETLRAILRAKGHSREAASMMSRCLRESSQQVYESHWSRFVAFCRTKRWHVFRVRSHHFSTYMMHLFRDGLLPSTIISHRTSVASVLRHWVYDPAADPHIKLLVRAFRLERPVQRRIMPKWDLHLVLLSLLRPSFTSQSEEDGESSDDVIPLKWRTLKCVFLLALASARRRSYLHALSIAPDRCVFARGNTQRQLVVSLLPEPGFLAKNQLPTQAPEWITVPGIAHLNPTEPERMLCPVRQLKLYIRDSERIRGGRQQMFIHWNRSIRDIMRSHISRWIVETDKEAYTQADRQYDRVTAHEVWALSASWAYNCQVALPDILSAAFWRSSGVFQNSYLRDMACIAEGMSTLGPVMVAQHVVDPGHLHPPP